jgi:hypothetical protein
MVVTRPTYATREEVKRALDIKETARNNAQIDRAIQSASRIIDKHLHRAFYPTDGTKYFDWPNFDYAYPWRLYFDQWDLAAVPTSVMTGTQSIPISNINFEPVNSGPPYRWLEIQRNTSYAFGVSATPQRDVSITGTWGYWTSTVPAGTLTAAMSSVSSTAVQVSNGALVGVGDLLIVDGERMLVQGRANVDSGQTNVSGATTASASDVGITVTDGTQLNVDEVIQIDSERMLIVDVTANLVTVKRGWDGTVLATHTAGTHIYASRSLTVARGQLGTVATTHTLGAAASISEIPAPVKDLAVAEGEVRAIQETGGYANPQGEGGGAIHGVGTALADLWDEAMTACGRKNRKRVI